jgi:hypothetical protein
MANLINLKDPSIRAFLLTNLTFPEDGAPVKFRVPVDIVKRSLDDIGGFPYEPHERTWTGKALIIEGKKSRYDTVALCNQENDEGYLDM